MMYEDADKTEAPTPRRRQEAREHGQVACSRELTGALTLLAVVLLLLGIGPWAWSKLSTFTTRFLKGGGAIDTQGLSSQVIAGLAWALGLVAAMSVIAWTIAWLSGHGQVRFLWTTKPR